MAIAYVFHHNNGGENYYDYWSGSYNWNTRLYNGQIFLVPEVLDSQGGDIGAKIYYYNYSTNSLAWNTLWQFDTINIPNGATLGSGKIYRLSKFNCSCYGQCYGTGSYYNVRRTWGLTGNPPNPSEGQVSTLSTNYQPIIWGTHGITETDQMERRNLSWLRMWGYKNKSTGHITETYGKWIHNDIRKMPKNYTINTY